MAHHCSSATVGLPAIRCAHPAAVEYPWGSPVQPDWNSSEGLMTDMKGRLMQTCLHCLQKRMLRVQ